MNFKSLTAISAPKFRRLSLLSLRATPITNPKPPLRPASTPELASSTTTVLEGEASKFLLAKRNMSGSGLPLRLNC